MPVRAVVGLLLAGSALAGCGDPQGADPKPHPDVTGVDSEVRLVDEAEANLVLFVSNQSFDDEEVHVTIALDGVTVVDDDFHVEGQHNWISFPLALDPGEHVITAESDSGGSMRKSFDTPTQGKRYAVIDYWDDNHDPTHFSWLLQRRPVAFG